ncbi:hypothetical protein [Mesorhizobium sp. LjNodule214]|uniref:hypothetical protein n=1 Tax=Mesorhizobium sp. LjNodule214 TaxID=3342252 RepID=UPI003ECF2D91
MDRYKYWALAGLIVAYLFFPKLFNIGSSEKPGLAATVNHEVATGCKSLDTQKILASWRSTIDTINRVDDHTAAVHVRTKKWAAAGYKGTNEHRHRSLLQCGRRAWKGRGAYQGLGAIVDGDYVR